MTKADPGVQQLRAGKAQLRRARIYAPLAEKIQDLLYLQRVYVDIVGSQRQLAAWQRPWNITNTVSDAVTLRAGTVESRRVGGFTASHSQWIRTLGRLAVRT